MVVQSSTYQYSIFKVMPTSIILNSLFWSFCQPKDINNLYLIPSCHALSYFVDLSLSCGLHLPTVEVHRLKNLWSIVILWSWVQVLKTASCRNAGKSCVHKIQSGRHFPRTLRKRELHAPGCPFLYSVGTSILFNERFKVGEILP
jgi:hypothetical protein